MDRWRQECLRALAQADPNGMDDRLVAYVIGAYFQAVHDGLAMVTDPQEQDLFSRLEAERFLDLLRQVPAQRQRLARAKVDALRREGLIVFPGAPSDGTPEG
jgi:hypothetical protein